MQIKYIQVVSLAAVFGLQYLFEHVFPQRKSVNDWRNERYNLAVGLINLAITFLPATLLVQWIGFIATKNLGLFHQLGLHNIGQLLPAIIILDFWMFAWHCMNHSIPLLWRFHRFHHRDEKMNSTTAIRFHTAELLLSYPGKALVIFVFGIDYLPLVIYEILFFAAIVVHHSNIRIGKKTDLFYRILFASPVMHRIHHSNQYRHTHSNFGSLFSFWDRIFGSFRNDLPEDVVFGLPPVNDTDKKV